MPNDVSVLRRHVGLTFGALRSAAPVSEVSSELRCQLACLRQTDVVA